MRPCGPPPLADGRNDFHALASAGGCREAHLIAFDLLSINGEDMRAKPLEARRSALAALLAKPPDGLGLSEHLTDDGEALYKHACRLGLEGIVSKRRGSRYRSGRSLMWRKVKCPGYERA